MRSRKMTLRFNPIEDGRIAVFAEAEGVTRSEAVRRLIFWHRPPGFVLPDNWEAPSQDHQIYK